MRDLKRPLHTPRLQRLPQPLPRHDDTVRRYRRDLRSFGDRFVEQGLEGFGDRADEVKREGFKGGDASAGQGDVGGGLDADEAHEAREAAAIGVEPDAGFGEAEGGGWGCEDDVAIRRVREVAKREVKETEKDKPVQNDLKPTAQCQPIHCCDDGFLAPPPTHARESAGRMDVLPGF